MSDAELARYIVCFLRRRNGAELDAAISAMSVRDFENMLGELEMILAARGKPPNWVG